MALAVFEMIGLLNFCGFYAFCACAVGVYVFCVCAVVVYAFDSFVFGVYAFHRLFSL